VASKGDAADIEVSLAQFFLVDVNTARLNELGAMVDSGRLATNIGTVLPLAEAVVAHEMLDGLRPHPRGKIVLEVR
jgi:NADPH:quinone reductase-like Zn-dependent oxidoreductase